jgi:hypothetical protein
MTTLLALIGVRALIYLYIWLLSAWLASYLSDRKGYGEKPGLATGVCLTFVAVIVWLIVPPRPESKWKRFGPVGRGETRKAVSG